jgi:hypothetical protein|tara:strand:+ start:8878 stop:9846 length:969 start_codon:yes stop_codon:yes gene_type:complete
MAIFLRIIDNKLLPAGNVSRLGFNQNNPCYIPNNYLKQQEFVVMRTCHGIGDWCIISAMPRLLKEKYPNCKVYIPSSTMLKNIWSLKTVGDGKMLNNWGYGTFDCSQMPYHIFNNNPYVDKFIDQGDGDIFHDHYKIYNENIDKIPLLGQMLNFWQFTEEEYLDSAPEIYFSDEEKTFGDKIIKRLLNSKEFGYIGASSTYGTSGDTSLIIDKIKEYNNLTWFYYGEQSIEKTDLNFLQNTIAVKEMNLTIRQQMYLKCKAKVNVGNETGMALWSSRYSPSYALGHKFYVKIHGPESEGKPRKNPFQTGNFVKTTNYLNYEE